MRNKPRRVNVLAAAKRIRGRAHQTPILTSQSLNKAAGLSVSFKCENLQRSGSFKFRGALNMLRSLSSQERQRGVVTHSSGNHGAALAAVAQEMGVSVTVIVPRQASSVKRAAVRRYGARVIDCGNTLAARERKLHTVVASTGAVYVPPYDHPAIIVGQGTTALEVECQVPSAQELWVPVGGGGLAAGCAIAAPRILQVVGAEPDLARDAFIGLQAGQRQPALPPRTCADGLRTALGELNFDILNAYDLPVYLVSEEEILHAQNLAMSCLKVLVEPSSAVPLAALLKYGPHNSASDHVCVVLTGGNVKLS